MYSLPIISALDLKVVKSLTISGKRKQCILSRGTALPSIKFPIEAPKQESLHVKVRTFS